jgi:hypothetical protein
MKKILVTVLVVLVVSWFSSGYAQKQWLQTACIAGGILWTDMTDEEMRETIDEIYRRDQTVILTWVRDPIYEDWFLDLKFLRKASEYMHTTYPGMALIIYQGPLEIVTPDVDSNRDGRVDPGKHSIYTDHPEWLQVGIDGRKAVFYGDIAFWIGEYDEDVWLCPNDPVYKERVKSSFSQLAETGIDGIWIDIPKFQCDFGDWDSNWACHCEDCVKKFIEDTGFELPRRVDWDSDVWKTWILWRQQVITDYIKELNNTVKSVNPECMVIVEHWHGIDSESVREAWSPILLQGVTDCLAHEYSAASSNSLTYDYYNYLRDVASYLFYRGLDGEHPSWVLAYSSEKKGQKMLAATLLTAGCNFYDTDTPDMDGTVSLQQQDEIFTWIKDYALYYYEGEPWGNTAVYYSKATMDFLYHEQWGEGDFYCEFMGISMMLLSSHIPYEVIFSLDDVNQFHTVILPNIAAMSDQEIEKVNEFVNKGGKVIATGETGTYDEWGSRRPQNLLDKNVVRIPGLGSQYYREVSPYNAWWIPEKRGSGEEVRTQFLTVLEALDIPGVFEVDAPKEVIILPFKNGNALIFRIVNLSGISTGEPRNQDITVNVLWHVSNGSSYTFLSSSERIEGNPVTLNISDHAILAFSIDEPVTIITNAFDKKAADILAAFLEKNGYFVETVSGCRTCMEQLRERTQLIIMGGHQAQITGEFVSVLLTEEEMDLLERKGAQKVFVKLHGFAEGQTVIIIAGCEREDTLKTVEDQYNEILDLLVKPALVHGVRCVRI